MPSLPQASASGLTGFTRPRLRPRQLAVGLIAISVGVFGIAGIRAYVAVFVMIGVVAAALTALLANRRVALWKTAAAYAVLIAVLIGAFARGAGDSYPYYKSLALSVLLSHSLAATMRDLDYARNAFAASGGATSFAGGTGILDDALHQSGTANTRLRRVARGSAAVFVPISVLQMLSIVTFNGGRGLLFITDIDTVVLDLTVGAALYFLIGSAPPRRALPILACLVVILLLTTGVLAYVVTNFGTLFRLRLLALVPLWLLPPFMYPDGSLRDAPAVHV